MPIYEYECKSCGEACEFLQAMDEPPKTECPHCHQKTLQKVLSAAGFQLKGSGWYVTDFKDKKTPEKTSEKTTPSESSSNKDAAKEPTSNKPETKTDDSKKKE